VANLYQASAGIGRLESLSLGDSPVHRLHPTVKLLTTLLYVGIVISFPSLNLSGLIPFLFYPFALMSAADIPYRPLFGRLIIALPFAMFGAAANLYYLRQVLFFIGGLAVTEGMISFLSILLKALLSVFAILILMATTSFTELSFRLAQMHIPKIFCLQIVLTYRYISVLLREAISMFTAYSLRAPGQKGIRMRDMGSFLGTLVLRSFDRANRVYQAMKCRGFDGVFRSRTVSGLRRADTCYGLVLTAAFLLLRLFNLSLFIGRLIYPS
jgi:cobalt/nickel transport system permease protein